MLIPVGTCRLTDCRLFTVFVGKTPTSPDDEQLELDSLARQLEALENAEPEFEQ